jgi:hypothetical protein
MNELGKSEWEEKEKSICEENRKDDDAYPPLKT